MIDFDGDFWMDMIPLLYSKSKFSGVFSWACACLEGMELFGNKDSTQRILITVDKSDPATIPLLRTSHAKLNKPAFCTAPPGCDTFRIYPAICRLFCIGQVTVQK